MRPRITSTSTVAVVVISIVATTAHAATAPAHAEPVPGIDWDSFNFGLNNVQTNAIWVNRVPVQFKTSGQQSSIEAKAKFDKNPIHCLQSASDATLSLSPASTVLSYGQALFEGLKAFRRADGTIALFRPERNAERMQQGARRFLLPPVPTPTFLRAADAVVRENAQWVPPYQKGALYLRPMLLGTGAALGVKPSHEATFCIYSSPVGNYFKSGLTAIRLQAVRGFTRAAPGGAGLVKASGNYAPAFMVQQQVRARGFDEVLCLDATTGECVEEAGASNFFAVFPHNKTIVTPSLGPGTILPGVTRSSIMELAETELGYTVVEGPVTLSALEEYAGEAFCCGTGACVTPVGCVSVWNEEGGEERMITFGNGDTGSVTRTLYDMLMGIQTGSDENLADKYQHWIHVVRP